VDELLMTEGRALKHVQVREYVRTLVAGAAPGSPAPSERELVHRFGVARMTVRQAMDALVVEGLLERIPGRGTFVARPRRMASRLSSYTEEMTRRGLLAESQTLLARREQAGPGVARALNVTEGDAVIHWRRLRRADGQPMCIEDAYLNEVLIPGFLQSGMPTSLYEALDARGLRPTWAEDSINADVASEEEGEHLEIPTGAPVLRHSRRALAGDKVVEVSRTVYRADRYTMWLQVGAEA
jgi:GntR family transcriptional regulator, N-acetylglucosamine utilization regulator